MEDIRKLKSDVEYENYLLKVRSHLEELVDSCDVDLSRSWIEKLTSCGEDETSLSKKYVYELCCQLSNGILESPFFDFPPKGKLSPYNSNVESAQDDNFTGDLDILFNGFNYDGNENANQEIPYNVTANKAMEVNCNSLTERTSSIAETVTLRSACASSCEYQSSELPIENVNSDLKPSCFDDSEHCPGDNANKDYECRANNLISKLREMKRQNSLLNKELLAMKAEASHAQICQSKGISKYDLYVCNEGDQQNNANFNGNRTHCLAHFNKKLMDLENFRYFFLDALETLEQQLLFIEENNKNKIKKIISENKVEVTKIGNSVRNELKGGFEKGIKELKEICENAMKQIEVNSLKREQGIVTMKNKIIKEKEELLSIKDKTIAKLEAIVEEQQSNLKTAINRLSDKYDSECNTDSTQSKVYQLERRLIKADRSKKKCVQAYERRLAQLEREKRYLICNFQLQLIRQKAHQATNAANDTDSKVNSVLHKLETKYKEVVANVQATAIKRRIQDQLTLDSVLKATYGISEMNENIAVKSTGNFNQREHSACLRSQNQKRSPNQSSERLEQRNKTLSDTSESSKLYIDDEILSDFLGKICVPQKDLRFADEILDRRS